ncbi:GloA Lactoylglutathione lyase and related lyases [Methylophilaceae bacterium]
MITEIRHTGLVVANLKDAIFFWQDILGFRLEKQMEESGPHIDAMMGLKDVHLTTLKMIAPEGGMVELLHFHSHPDKPEWLGKPFSTGFTHIALTVVDLEDSYKKLITAGVKFPGLPQYSKDGSVKVIYCKGPEGVLIELVEKLKT